MMKDLFAGLRPSIENIGEGVSLFPAYADTAGLMTQIEAINRLAPFRHMQTPGGNKMSVAMTNCGKYGWVSGNAGYRYAPRDPISGDNWPEMPECFRTLAQSVAGKAGFSDFDSDSCLINRYAPGTKLTPHQDKNERDMRWPIVSVSIGVSATFLLYGNTRGGSAKHIQLHDGDVLVWGGKARLYYHGIKTLKTADHALTGKLRYNLTFRRAG